MPFYKYTAMSPTGEKIQGTYTAVSKGEVLAMLRQKQFHPLKIMETNEGKNDIHLSFLEKVKIKDIAIFARQFYTMLNAGVPIINCLNVLSQQTESKKLKEVIEDVYQEIQKGLTFSDALRNHKKVFPELLINMVDAGEISGNLDGIMERMADHYERESKINNKIKGAMVYPIVLSIVAVIIIVFLLTYVMPTFISMFEGSGVPLPTPTRILLFISHTLVTYWYGYVIGIITMFIGFNGWISSEGGRRAFDKIKLKMPIVRRTTQKIITSRFSRTLSTLLSSGIPLVQALESTGRVVGNKVVEDGIRTAIDEISKGTSLGGPIKKIGVFPPMLISMIEIGEESGALDDILDKTANFFDEETEVALQKMTTLLEPLMIVIMAVIIGFIVLAMMLPVFDMVNTIGM